MFKKIIKWVLSLLLVSILLCSAFIYHEWNAKPFFINNFFNRVALKVVLDSPETLTSLHFLESMGINGHNAELDNASPDATKQLFDYVAQEKQVLAQYNNQDLTEDQIVSKRLAEYLFNLTEEFEPFKYHNYPVNQLFGLQNDFPSFMQSQHQIHSIEDAEFYIQRLNQLPKKFNQALQGLKLRADNKIIPPQFVIDRVVEEMTNFSQQSVEKNILYTAFSEKLEKLDVAADDKKQLLETAKQSIINNVYPAYVEMTRYFNGLADKADDRDGIWKLPNGDKAYEVALKFFTSTDYSPEFIHNAGLQEVARIQQEILTILETEGFDVSSGFFQAIETLAAQARFYYPDNAKGRAEILEDYQKIITEIDQGLASAFNIRPKASVKVERIPEFKEKTSPGAYYIPPAIDGSRDGIFYANLYDIKATPKYSMRTLAYHEAIPGHHFQVSIAQELEDMPIFRKFAPFTAYTEGWALYSERLAWELGYQENPFDNIGRLQAELFRAVRLVVDTGIHAQRWTRQEARDYMKLNTGMAESDVISEIERYIVMPGQACAYKVGMMKILELRAKAKESLGSRFDLAAFHDVILKNGPVPLNILEEFVDQYIQTNQ
jgi:uncharacterized protein (DUF885 family)